MTYCQVCKKNIAAVHYTEIDINYKVKKETHMCEPCAQTAGLQGAVPKSITPIQIIENLIKPNLPQTLKMLLETQCEACGMTYPEFRSSGRLGCPEDYKIFKEGINTVLEQVQGQVCTHTGKVPKRGGGMIKLQAEETVLRRELDEAVAREDYEKAAEIRDAIQDIEEQLREQKD